MNELKFATKEFQNEELLKADNNLLNARNTTELNTKAYEDNEPVTFVTVEEYLFMFVNL